VIADLRQWWHELSTPKRWLWGLTAVMSVLGLFALTDVVRGWVLLAPVVVLVAFGLGELSRFCRALVEVAGAVAVPWLSLLGFNYVAERLVDRSHLVLALIVACTVFAGFSFAYLVAWREKPRARLPVAVVLAVANVVLIPYLVTSHKAEAPVGAAAPIVSHLDVAIVVPDGTPPPAPDVDPANTTGEWSVQYSVARTSGGSLEWLLFDSPDPAAALTATAAKRTGLTGDPEWRQADKVVLLDVDGTPAATDDPKALASLTPAHEDFDGWLAAVKRARRGAPDASIAVLLQTTDASRLAEWRKRVEPLGGSVASVQALNARTFTDAAFQLAAQAPDADADLALALRFRPVLLFDSRDDQHTPLEIDDFLKKGRIGLCHDGQANDHCPPVRAPSELVNGLTHLKIYRAKRGAKPPVSAIYVHPTKRTYRDGRKLLVLDYWWYLERNPADVGKGASCGPGLALPGKTCFDHDSDWEGMVVIVDVSAAEPVPLAVTYASHKDVTRYAFAALRGYWDRKVDRPDADWNTPSLARLRSLGDRSDRPLVFIAKGTHGAYGFPCRSSCDQPHKGRPENRYNGARWWPPNDTATCIATNCVRLVPTRERGTEPALWNAYTGLWGDRYCVLRGTFCTAENAPGAPATQRRYRDPLRMTISAVPKNEFHPCAGDCPGLPPTR
jgi:hypothetical protein